PAFCGRQLGHCRRYPLLLDCNKTVASLSDPIMAHNFAREVLFVVQLAPSYCRGSFIPGRICLIECFKKSRSYTSASKTWSLNRTRSRSILRGPSLRPVLRRPICCSLPFNF